MLTNREVALCFYRINLHGTGWKVESGRFDDALHSLSEHIKFAKGADKAQLVGLKKDVLALKCRP
jgi:hypothetical protein